MFGEIIGGLVGGLLGGEEQTTTQQQRMDPRMDKYVYGDESKRGLLDMAYNVMQDQYKTGGLNPTQQAGLEMQRQFLMSPQYQQGFSNMLGMGQSLMGGGVAGNPFMGNAKQSFAGAQFPTQQFGYQTVGVPQTMVDAATQPMNFAPPPEAEVRPETVEDIVDRYMRDNKLGKYAETDDGFGNWKMRG